MFSSLLSKQESPFGPLATWIRVSKRGTVSDSLRSFMTKEELLANRSCRSVKKSNMGDSLLILASRSQKRVSHSKKFIFFVYLWQFFTALPLFYAKEWFTLVAFWQRIDCERNTPFALFKRLNVSDSLPSLITKLQKSDGSNSLFFASELLFRSQKTSDLLEKPMSEFPTLIQTDPHPFQSHPHSYKHTLSITPLSNTTLSFIWRYRNYDMSKTLLKTMT